MIICFIRQEGLLSLPFIGTTKEKQQKVYAKYETILLCEEQKINYQKYYPN